MHDFFLRKVVNYSDGCHHDDEKRRQKVDKVPKLEIFPFVSFSESFLTIELLFLLDKEIHRQADE